MSTYHLEEMDIYLDLYYQRMGVLTYFDADSRRGRFSKYCITHKLSSCIKAVFKNEDLTASIEQCPFLEFDPFFPYSSKDLTKYEKKREVQWVIQHCFAYKEPPFLQKQKYVNCKTFTPLRQKKNESNFIRTLPRKQDVVEEPVDLDLCIAQLTGSQHWSCAQCTFNNPWSISSCSQCGYKRYKNIKGLPQEEEEVQDTKNDNAYFVNLLVYGFGRQLSEETGYQIPAEIEKMLLSYYYLCACWDDSNLCGYFQISGFMNDCLERTSKGHGCWHNMLSEQCIVAKGRYLWKLRVKELELYPNAHTVGGGGIAYNHRIIVGLYGIREHNETPENMQKPFALYENGFGKHIDCHAVDQVIDIHLNFEYNDNETVGLMTINGFRKCLIPKLHLNNDKQITRRHFNFALAMSSKGLKMEFFHFAFG